MLEAAPASDEYEAELRVTLSALNYITFPAHDGKRKIVPVHIIKEHEGSGSTDPVIPNDGTRWRKWTASQANIYSGECSPSTPSNTRFGRPQCLPGLFQE